MTASTSLTPDSCSFDLYQVATTLSRYELLSVHDVCPHIHRVTARSDGLEFYAIMDSNCFVVHPFCAGFCNKGESSLLRLALHKSHRNRNQRPQEVTCILRSLNPELLTFPQGAIEAGVSVLDLMAAGKKLRAGSFYRKKLEPFSVDHLPVEVEQYPESELRRARVEIDVIVLRDYPRPNTHLAELSVAIPARTLPSHKQDITTTNKGGTTMTLDPITTSVLVEGIKLLLQDGYGYLKRKVSLEIADKQDSTSVVLKGRQLESGQVTSDSLGPVLNEINQIKLAAKTSELQGLIGQFGTLHSRKKSLLLVREEGTTASDRADVDFRVGKVDQQIVDVAQKIEGIMKDLFGQDFVVL